MSPSTAAIAVSELDAEDQRLLAKKHPAIAGHKKALVVAADDLETLSLARVLTEAFTIQNRQMRALIEVMLPALDIPDKATILQARGNAAAREALIQEFGAFTSAQVAQRAGSTASNRAALANRWRKEGRIFGVTLRGQTRFPAFQLDDDSRPLPVIAAVLEHFKDRREPWETALWFTTKNSRLDDARPVDLLAGDAEQVVEAARHEVTGFVF